MKLSVIIPAYKEPYLQKTVSSLLDTSELGDQMEIIVVLDGPWLDKPLTKDPRVRVLELEKNVGMRAAINAGISLSWGEYIMKVDAHCAFDQGFDRKMIAEMKDSWLLIPRRYSLKEETWDRDTTSDVRDYHYYEYPKESVYGSGLNVLDWIKSNDKEIDDTMTFQGSCWVANKKFFMKQVGILDEKLYGSFVGEQHEIGLKYWLGEGEIKVNKKTWYAHLSKRAHHYDAGMFERDYKLAEKTKEIHTLVAKHWMENKEPGMKPFSSLIEKFQPPTWPK